MHSEATLRRKRRGGVLPGAGVVTATAGVRQAAQVPMLPPVPPVPQRFPVGSRLHIGCGPKRIAGWLNTDGVAGVGPDGVVELHDPQLPASTFRVIYGCHVLEHCWPQDTPRILGALREALLPGGTLRLSVPDIRLVVANCIDAQLFGDEKSALSVVYGGLFSRETAAPDLHRQTFWKERLTRLLNEAGYVNIRAWGVGQYPEIDAVRDWATHPLDAAGRSMISLNLEADRSGVIPVIAPGPQSGVDVSVLLGTVEREVMLRQCVEKIRTSLLGSGLSYEIIVAYGHNNEPALPWMRAQVDVVPVLGGMDGAIPAFNRAYAVSRGRFVCVINDDVLVDGDSIARAARHLESDVTSAGVVFKHDVGDGKGYHYSLFGNGILHPNELIARRSTCEAVIEQIGALWGDEKHRTDKTYGGDSAFGAVCHHLRLRLDGVEGVTCRDRRAADALRQRNAQVAADHSSKWGAMYFPMLSEPTVVPAAGEWPNLYVPRPGAPPRRSPVAAGRPLRLLHLSLASNEEPQTDLHRALARIGPTVAVPWLDNERNAFEAAREHRPDIVWAQIQSNTWNRAMTDALRAAVGPKCILCLWSGDVRTSGSSQVERWMVERGNDFDLVLASNTLYPRKLRLDEKVRAACGYLGCGVDPTLNMWDPSVGEAGGAVFLGSNYQYLDGGERERLFAAVNAELPGMLTLYGGGWAKSSVANISRPFITKQVSTAIMQQAAVTISTSLFHDLPRYTSDRLKRAMTSGAVVAVRAFPDMEGLGLVPGKNCLVWSSPAELVTLLREWTKSERAAERRTMRTLAVAVGRDRYPWDRIVEELLAIVRDYQERR